MLSGRSWPSEELAEAQKAIARLGLSDIDKGDIAYRAIEAVHTDWVRRNESKFFDPTRLDRQYMFLPVELIGYQDAVKDYIFIEDILAVLTLRPESRFIEQAYKEARRRYSQRYPIHFMHDLERHINHGDCYVDSGNVKKELGRTSTAMRVAYQVISHNGSPEFW